MSKSRFFTEDWSRPLPTANRCKPDYSSDEETLDSLFQKAMPFIHQHPQLETLVGVPAMGNSIYINGLFYYCKELTMVHLTNFELMVTMNAETLAVDRAMQESDIQLALQGSVQFPNDFVMGLYNEINNSGEDYHIGVFKR